MNNTSDHAVDAAPTTDGIIDQQPTPLEFLAQELDMPVEHIREAAEAIREERMSKAAADMHQAFYTMKHDWESGDFELPRLAEVHMNAIEDKALALGKLLRRAQNKPSPAPQSVAAIEAQSVPATTTDDLTAMKLGDEFDAALLGATITGQYAYSLTRLSMIVMQDLRVHPEVAQKMVAEQVVTVMREHGAESPVFVDDSLMFGADIAVEPETESPAIFVGGEPRTDVDAGGTIFVADEPKEPQPIFTGEAPTPQPIFTGASSQASCSGDKPDTNVILIPGVTHGAIKGFLDPNGIKS